MKLTAIVPCVVFFLSLFSTTSCKNNKHTTEGFTVTNVSSKDEAVQDEIENALEVVATENSIEKLNLPYAAVINHYYSSTNNAPIWINNLQFTPAGNQLAGFVKNASYSGLYSEDYNAEAIEKLYTSLKNDSTGNAVKEDWAKADMLLTNAFFGIANDLHRGRLFSDSLHWRNDTSKYNSFYGALIDKAKATVKLDTIFASIEPKHTAYLQLKKGIKNFVDSMDTRSFTYVTFPYKDSLAFIKSLKKRLQEAGIEVKKDTSKRADSIALSAALKSFQAKMGITADGKIGPGVIKKMNTSDKQRFNALAITLDKYKKLAPVMPQKYIWVNMPAYNLKVIEGDSAVLESRVIVGKPTTPTPIITSEISDMVLYPTWTVPNSIILKELLPGLRRNANYLARRGLYLVTSRGKKINPGSINWAKYTKGIPYMVQQASGDRNALGVMKFNFENEHSVYLHDTNQRYLFNNGVRCLSHGCVRVQQWKQLATYIARHDSTMQRMKGDSLKYNPDTIGVWLAQKQNRKIDVKNHIPLFIQYFSCEYVNGRIKFYDDMYYEDRDLKQRYFANK
jgi:L,D-transpeptidase YcbB